jgi:chromosome segregation ATPase
LAHKPKGRDLSPVSDRVAEIFRLAGDEAEDMVDAARAEAAQILGGAQLEADARLRKASQIKETAAAAADGLRDMAQQDRADAAAVLERARGEAEQLRRGAGEERDRLRGEVAQARAQLAAVQAELDDLRGQRDHEQESLWRLTDRIAEALEAVSGATERFVVVGNTVESNTVEGNTVEGVLS